MLTRKALNSAAKEIVSITNIEARKQTARCFIRFFISFSKNERFDKDRFWQACNLGEYLLEL